MTVLAESQCPKSTDKLVRRSTDGSLVVLGGEQ